MTAAAMPSHTKKMPASRSSRMSSRPAMIHHTQIPSVGKISAIGSAPHALAAIAGIGDGAGRQRAAAALALIDGATILAVEGLAGDLGDAGNRAHHRSGVERQHQHLLIGGAGNRFRSEEHTSELQSRRDLVCRLLLEKKKK